MGPRVSGDLLLVGSLPADSTETALRTASDLPGVTELHWDAWPRIDDAIDC